MAMTILAVCCGIGARAGLLVFATSVRPRPRSGSRSGETREPFFVSRFFVVGTVDSSGTLAVFDGNLDAMAGGGAVGGMRRVRPAVSDPGDPPDRHDRAEPKRLRYGLNYSETHWRPRRSVSVDRRNRFGRTNPDPSGGRGPRVAALIWDVKPGRTENVCRRDC